ncbi:MAG: hypothetical protein AAB618_02680 [Patescibacteria group bacterium]
MRKKISDSLYHSVLRVATLVTALVLLFESGLVSPVTKQLSQDTHFYLANAVGMSVSIAPTELNSLTAELTRQKLALEAREQALKEREIEIGLASGGATNSDTATYVLAGVLFILLVLIVLNYVLDYLRFHQKEIILRSKTV